MVSLGYSEFKTELNEEQNQRSFGDKLGDFLDKNQVNIQLLTIYAGLIGIVLEGNYSDNLLFLDIDYVTYGLCHIGLRLIVYRLDT